MIENWRPVVGYESIYEVSDQGRVRSLDRVQYDGRRRKGRFMALSSRGSLYIGVSLHKLGSIKTFLVHRLMLEAFRGPAPDGMQGRHLDGNGSHNVLSNLDWGTSLENHADKKAHGTTAKGVSNKQAKLGEADVLLIRDSNELGTVLARRYFVTPTTISYIRNRITWAHI